MRLGPYYSVDGNFKYVTENSLLATLADHRNNTLINPSSLVCSSDVYACIQANFVKREMVKIVKGITKIWPIGPTVVTYFGLHIEVDSSMAPGSWRFE